MIVIRAGLDNAGHCPSLYITGQSYLLHSFFVIFFKKIDIFFSEREYLRKSTDSKAGIPGLPVVLSRTLFNGYINNLHQDYSGIN
jgi:hypothetical protein